MEDKIKNTQIEILNDTNSFQEQRIQALFQLMNIADKESLDSIINCLKNDSCEIVRHEAAFVLGETASSEVVEDLKFSVLNDKSVIVKHESLLALGTLANKEIIPFLQKQMESKIKLIRESAKIALQRVELFETPYRGPDKFNYLKNIK